MENLLDENKKQKLRKKIEGLDLTANDFMDNVQNIVNEVVAENADVFGEKKAVETLSEAVSATTQVMNNARADLTQDDLDLLGDSDTANNIMQVLKNYNADEERDDLESQGLSDQQEIVVTVGNMTQEIVAILAEVINQKQKELAEAITTKNQLKEDVKRREDLRKSQIKFRKVRDASKDLKGKQGKALHEATGRAVDDLQRKINELADKTKKDDGTELSETDVDKEIKAIEAQQVKLEALLTKLKDAQRIKAINDKAQEKLDGVKAQKQYQNNLAEVKGKVDPLVVQIRQGMNFEDLNRIAAELKQLAMGNPLAKQYMEDNKVAGVKISKIEEIAWVEGLRANYFSLVQEMKYTEADESIKKSIAFINGTRDTLKELGIDENQILPMMTEDAMVANLRSNVQWIDTKSTGGVFKKDEKTPAQMQAACYVPGYRRAYEAVKGFLIRPWVLAKNYNNLVDACGDKAVHPSWKVPDSETDTSRAFRMLQQNGAQPQSQGAPAAVTPPDVKGQKLAGQQNQGDDEPEL